MSAPTTPRARASSMTPRSSVPFFEHILASAVVPSSRRDDDALVDARGRAGVRRHSLTLRVRRGDVVARARE